MKKNVAGQTIGCEMISASDGSAFTGSVTVLVTGDNGAQTTGSVGGGACTSKGNGLYTYAPAQAETNFNFVEFTFVGTNAIPQSLHIYTSFPQTADVGAGVTVATGGIASTSFAAGAINNAAYAAGAIDAAEITQAAAQKIADELLNRKIVGGASGGSRTVTQALRRLRNKIAISGGIATIYLEDDTTADWAAAVGTTAGNPVSSIAPTS